jgi:hypothetical protein
MTELDDAIIVVSLHLQQSDSIFELLCNCDRSTSGIKCKGREKTTDHLDLD